MRAPLAALLCALAAVGGGCSIGEDEDDAPEPTSGGSERVETTRVQVVEGLGDNGGFDPTAIYDRLGPGVVTVISLFDGGGGLLGEQEGGLGSGFVLDGEGFIATNAHVVTNGQALSRARQVFVQFGDGNRVPARIVGTDPNADVALLKIEPRGLDLTPLDLGDLDDLKVGDPVAAIGSPFGEEQSLSVGVVSALDRDIQSLTDFGIGDAIQTDAAINRGNSGGPLLDEHGRVVGINAQIRTETGEGAGVGFAVPVDTVQRSLDQLREDGEAEYGYLGVSTQALYPQLAEKLGHDVEIGALVDEVVEDSPADEAGLTAGDERIDFQGQTDIAADGDVIVSVNGERITSTADLADLVSLLQPGDTVELGVIRGGDRRTIEVELGERPRDLSDD
ncbi:MAG TPA: trypsin-like peptidase domain-containing protein [Thermoleophilaceae bacterium]|nr:trypsin-like peptidase domain-containing protein [Thermoleophilaceae bacterium]